MNRLKPFGLSQSSHRLGRNRFPGNLRERLRIWWREVDKVLLGLILTLMLIGTLAVSAASPASAIRLSTSTIQLNDFYFFRQHMVWQIGGLTLMIAVSLLPRFRARQLGIVIALLMFFLLSLVPIFGFERNGAQRWLDLGFSFQPSEFLKPGFAVLIAWILSLRLREPELPVVFFSLIFVIGVGTLLMMQPNLGATLLFAGIWFVLVLLSGVGLRFLGVIVGASITALTATYFLYDNARNRIDAFLGGGTAYDQVDLAQRTLTAGGWSGTGLWLGVRKMNLPEAHTDYIFSVIGEEFGLLTCAIVVLVYLTIIWRVLLRLIKEEDLFSILAGAGLVTVVGGQAFINILVNLQLFPSKGMTLPLISYGGSSTIAMCLTAGLLLAITRRNPSLKGDISGLRSDLELGGYKR
jgi:cell division protein FtsW